MLNVFSFADHLAVALLSSPEDVAILSASGDHVLRGDFARILSDIRMRAQAAGLVQGCRVATLLPDDWTTGAIVLGLLNDLSIAPLNPALTEAELLDLVRGSRACGIIADKTQPVALTLAQMSGLPLLSPAELLGTCPLHTRFPPQTKTDFEPGLLLLTSGSTGAPKRVAIAPSAMIQSAMAIAHTLSFGPQDRALLALPMFHVGAFVDLLLAPLLSGGSVAVVPERSARSLLAAVETFRPTWMQLVPTMLSNLLQSSPQAERVFQDRPLRFVRSVSAGLSPKLQMQAETLLGCPVIQMYGMTETAGQICSNPLPPLRRKPESVGRPAGPEVAIMDGAGNTLQPGEIGEVCVRGASVFKGYEDQPSDGIFHEDWFRTGDLGRFDDENYLFLTGRVKEIINRGGEKISPFEIEQAVLAMPQILEAAAFAVPHPTLGEQVGLSVVAEAGTAESEVLAHLRDCLGSFKCPRRVQFLSQMPRLGSTKIDKLTLARTYPQSFLGTETTQWAGSDLKLAHAWARCLHSDLPEADRDFFDAGGDSLSATTFILDLEAMFDGPISPNLLFDHPTFGALCTAMVSHKLRSPVSKRWETASSSSVRYAHTLMAGWPGVVALPGGVIRGLDLEQAKEPLFWCCQASFEVTEMRRILKNARPIYGMATLFRQPNRTEAHRRELARHYAAEIQMIRPEGDLNLGGFCEGANIMAIVAELLRQAGRRVRFFISIDHAMNDRTDYPVFHLRSDYFKPHNRSELAFPVLHPKGACLTKYHCAHKEIMSILPPLAEELDRYLDSHDSLPPIDDAHVIPLEKRAELYKGRVRARISLTYTQNSIESVAVRLFNKSPHVWLPTEKSGLALAAIILNLDTSTRERGVGYCEIVEAISPGGHADLEMELRIGDHRGPFLLMVLMTDHGIGDFPLRSGAWAIMLKWPALRRHHSQG